MVLCRETDVGDLVKTVQSHQRAYLGPPDAPLPGNRAHDLVVFSETPWSAAAEAKLRAATSSTVIFDLLGEDAWGTPTWINRTVFDGILQHESYYGNTESYRRMCRFFAGPVWRRPILQEYTWVWRLDSHVRYLCDIVEDPVGVLEASNGTYGYAITMTELMYTIPTLWSTMMSYGKAQGLDGSVRAWGVDPASASQRGCHFWNNMEIARVSFFATGPYQALFKHLDEVGGFFYERWGDAPIRSWALMLLEEPSRVHWFDIGYQHPWWVKCPATCPGRDRCMPDPEITPQERTDGKRCKVGE